MLAYVDPIGKVGAEPVAGHALIGYDDVQAIQYFHENRPAYWTHEGAISIQQAFEQGDASYTEMMRRCCSTPSRGRLGCPPGRSPTYERRSPRRAT